MASFQRTPCVAGASHFTGCPGLSTTPVALGPRNCGQFCAEAVVTKTASKMRESVSRFIRTSGLWFWFGALQLDAIRALLESSSGDLAGFAFERDRDAVEGDWPKSRFVDRHQLV